MVNFLDRIMIRGRGLRRPGELALDGSRIEYYRSRARMIRSLADKCSAAELKAEYERIAEQYEQLARDVEEGRLSR